MTQPLPIESSPAPRPTADKPVLVFVMTDIEQGAILPALRGFGEQLSESLADQLAKHVPGVARENFVCRPDEIMGRALAYIAQADPEDFGRQIAGSQLKIQVVPHMVPCPSCAKRRIATMNQGKCKTCGGAGRIVMVIAPEQRLIAEEQINKPKLALVDASGRDIIGR